MNVLKRTVNYFSKFELGLWASSVVLIVVSFLVFDRSNYLTLFASLLGATAILLNAKGNPLGQLFMIVFCLIYVYISISFSYYGEVATYLGMTLPMSVIALISWLKHPFKGKKTEVEVNRLSLMEDAIMFFLAFVVTVVFYFILKYFHTANLVPSTFSITTSFLAVYLTFRRSPYFSLAYALNDVVLIVLWLLASMEDAKYISVVVCFLAFLINDLYAYYSWKKMEKRQQQIVQA